MPNKTIYNPIDQPRIFHYEINRQCTACVLRNIWTSSEFQLPQATIFLSIIAQAQKPNCLNHKFSLTKLIKQSTLCIPNKTICNPIDQQSIFHYEVKQTVHSMCAEEHLNKLWIPTPSSKNFERIIAQAKNSTSRSQKVSILQENRYCTPCVRNKIIPNLIF